MKWVSKCLPKEKKFDKITQVEANIGDSPSGKATDSDSVIRVFESLIPSQTGFFSEKNVKKCPFFLVKNSKSILIEKNRG